MADKKMGLILALAGKPEKKAKDSEEESSSREVAAQAMLDAIEAKDAKMLAEAAQSLYDACSMHGDDYDDEA